MPAKSPWRQYTDYIHHLLRLRLEGAAFPYSTSVFLWGVFVRFGVVGLSGGVFCCDMAVALPAAYRLFDVPLTRSKTRRRRGGDSQQLYLERCLDLCRCELYTSGVGRPG